MSGKANKDIDKALAVCYNIFNVPLIFGPALIGWRWLPVIFGKHINRYYLRYGAWLLLGILALAMVDTFQLKIPELYRMVINGMNNGVVEQGGMHLRSVWYISCSIFYGRRTA